MASRHDIDPRHPRDPRSFVFFLCSEFCLTVGRIGTSVASAAMNSTDSTFELLRGREIVIDVASPYVYIGKLTGYDEKYLILEQADVHDLRDTTKTRESYVVDSRRLGIRTNREKVFVRIGEIVSLSALEDVIV